MVWGRERHHYHHPAFVFPTQLSLELLLTEGENTQALELLLTEGEAHKNTSTGHPLM